MSIPLKKKVVLPLGTILLGLLITLMLANSRPNVSQRTTPEKIWPVNVMRAKPINIQPKISIYGEVRAAREAELRSVLGGRISNLNPIFRNGNLLKKGTQLLAIERNDYENLAIEKRADLIHAEAVLNELRSELIFEKELLKNSQRQVELARRAFDRTTELARQGTESKKAIDDAESNLAQTEKDKILREQKVARLGSKIEQQAALHKKANASVATAEQALADTMILAPFEGYVADVQVALGQLLVKGEKIGRLLSARELEVQFELPEGDYGRFTSKKEAQDQSDESILGRPLEIIWELGSEEHKYAATLTRIGPELNVDTGGGDMFASVDLEAVESGLRSGAFVEVLFPDFEYQNVFQVPIRAVADAEHVYVIREQRLVRLPVEVVGKAEENLLIRAKILSGELIVSRLFENIGPGLRVKAL